MMFEIECGQIPPLEVVLESDRRYFEENPEAVYGMRLPHPDEWADDVSKDARWNVRGGYQARTRYPGETACGDWVMSSRTKNAHNPL